jgi:hypothetical protein
MRFSHRRMRFSHCPKTINRTLDGLLGVPALISCFDLSVCPQPVYLSLFYRSDWLTNPIACAFFPPGG